MALGWFGDLQEIFSSMGSGGSINVAVGIIIALVYVAIALGAGWFILRFLKYKYKIFIFEKTKSGISIEQDKARLDHKDNVSKLKLFKSKDEIEAPLGHIMMMEKKKRWVFFERRGGLLQPLEFSINSPAVFEPISNYAQYWAAVRSKEKMEKHLKQSVWEKYGNVIIFVGTMAICFVLILLTLSYAQEMAADATAKWSSVMKAAPISPAGVAP